MNAVGLLVVRLALATVLVAHGAHIVFGLFGGPAVGPGGLSDVAARLADAGVAPGLPFAVFAGGMQLIGGLLIALGLLTRWAAVALILYIGIDVWLLRLSWGFFLNWTLAPGVGNGFEYALLQAGVLACLALAGAGDLSLDGRKMRAAATRAAGRARLRCR